MTHRVACRTQAAAAGERIRAGRERVRRAGRGRVSELRTIGNSLKVEVDLHRGARFGQLVERSLIFYNNLAS